MCEKIQRTVYLLRRTDKKDDGTVIYVGSTSRTLRERLWNHRHHSKNCDSKLYTRMKEVGTKNWEIISLETVPSCDKKEIFILEKKWVELKEPDLNTLSPVRENNEKSRESSKRHYFDSLENKRYYCDVCEKSFGRNSGLKNHFNSLKHQRAYSSFVD